MHNRTTNRRSHRSQRNTGDGVTETAVSEAPATNDPAPEATPAMQRAEEMVDQMAERIGHYASVVGHKMLWFVARAREEAEDIWAEAQELRRQKQQQATSTAESTSE